MLVLRIGSAESYNDETQEFVELGGENYSFEHSLVSIAEWESKWEIPFIPTKEKTDEQVKDYIKFMSVDGSVTDEVIQKFTVKDYEQIQKYISAKMTATWFPESRDKGRKGSSEAVTAELVYYWMVSLQIPVEFQHWHINRLLTLIQVCNRKNQPEKKMSKSELASRNRALNEARRKQYGTTG